MDMHVSCAVALRRAELTRMSNQTCRVMVEQQSRRQHLLQGNSSKGLRRMSLYIGSYDLMLHGRVIQRRGIGAEPIAM